MSRRKEAAVFSSRSVGNNAWQISTTIYQVYTGKREIAETCTRACLSLNVFLSLLKCLLCLGKTLSVAAKLLVFRCVCPLSYPAFTPSLESAWVEMQHITGPELIICRFPLISHSMFAALLPRVNSSCVDVPRVAYGIQSTGPDGR